MTKPFERRRYVLVAVILGLLIAGAADAAASRPQAVARPDAGSRATAADRDRREKDGTLPRIIRLVIKQLSHDLIGPRP